MPSNSKSCHNCRRRRLRCDRSWPSCHKCAVSGQECLGYGQLLVWTEGIDANGNLKKPAPSASRKASVAAASLPRVGNDDYDDAALVDGAPRVQQQHHRQQHQQLQLRQQQGHHHDLQSQPSLPAADPLAHPHPHQEALGFNPEDAAPATPTSGSLISLTDPLFQDLDRNSRYYLTHFANRVCHDMANAKDHNPFRELIPLANKHPLLLEILVATSAMHWSNIFRPVTTIPGGMTDADTYLTQLRSKDLVSRGAFIDALSAKQRAMGHLRGVLDSLDPAGSEVVLAAMHFFIKFDLIDMEKTEMSSWKTHLEGAFSILSLLAPETPGNSTHRMLRDCVIADCFIYHILGSTLAASGNIAARITHYAIELLPVLKRVEMSGYLACPPDILQVILAASQLSYDAPSDDWSLSAADDALSLIGTALEFDVDSWASRVNRLDVADVESRSHVAAAHRSAACLYILQALPLARAARTVNSDDLVNDIMHHLSYLTEEDWFFKATSWPIFIAGAETRDAAKRTWCLQRLLAIWKTCPWGYIFTAVEMLKATWQMQDANPNIDAEVNWLRDLKGMGFDYLIV